MVQKAKNIYHLGTSFLFNLLYGFPARKLVVIGVTGTSGKTTTTHMIYEILHEAGYNVSMLSTIEGIVGGRQLDTGFHVTTPDPHLLPKYLREAVNHGDTHFVLEISSHALDQNRAAFIHFAVGVLTTLAHEHLDYHKTFTNYARAKFKLLHKSDTAVVPVNLSEEIKKIVNFENLKQVISFGLAKGDVNQLEWELRVRMPGEFNVLNGLAAAAATQSVGVDKKQIREALKIVASLPGRYEEIKTGKGFRVIIDFAHKPDALEGIIRSVIPDKKNGRIITMFGCAAQRDVLKRPMMGKISGDLSDITVLTNEDPRFEDPMKIINEIAQGCEKAGAKERSMKQELGIKKGERVYFKIPDRKEAIEFIIHKLAKKGDIILLCGKGHERSMNYRGVEKPWSEQDALEHALKRIKN